MSIKIVCPKCNSSYNVAEAALGKMVKCQKCQASFAAKALAGSVAGKTGTGKTGGTGAAVKPLASPGVGKIPMAMKTPVAGGKLPAVAQQELARYGVDGPISASPSLFASDRSTVAGPDPLGNHVVQGLNFVPVDPKKLAATQAAELASANPFERIKKVAKANAGHSAVSTKLPDVNTVSNDGVLIAKWYTNLLRAILLSTVGMVIFLVSMLVLFFVLTMFLAGTMAEQLQSGSNALLIVYGFFIAYMLLSTVYSFLGLIAAWYLTDKFRPDSFSLYLALSLLVPMAFHVISFILLSEARQHLKDSGAKLGWTGAKFR